MGLFSSVVTKVFGTRSERELKSIRPIVAKIESLEGQYKSMTDAELRGQTERFRGRLSAGGRRGRARPPRASRSA